MRAEDHRRDLTRDSETRALYIRARRRGARVYLYLCKTRAQKIFKPVSPLRVFSPSWVGWEGRGSGPVIVIDNSTAEPLEREETRELRLTLSRSIYKTIAAYYYPSNYTSHDNCFVHELR